jgi:hypothetical protein
MHYRSAFFGREIPFRPISTYLPNGGNRLNAHAYRRFHKATRFIRACSASACLLFTAHALPGWAQLSASSLPSPVLVRCDAHVEFNHRLQDPSAMQALNRASEAMDPAGAYKTARQFNLQGAIVTTGSSNNQAQQSGSFQVWEDHSVPDGDVFHQITIDGVEHVLTRHNGSTQQSTAPTAAPSPSYLLPFVAFPLAVLDDGLLDSSALIHSAAGGISGASRNLLKKLRPPCFRWCFL